MYMWPNASKRMRDEQNKLHSYRALSNLTNLRYNHLEIGDCHQYVLCPFDPCARGVVKLCRLIGHHYSMFLQTQPYTKCASNKHSAIIHS